MALKSAKPACEEPCIDQPHAIEMLALRKRRSRAFQLVVMIVP